MKINRLNQHIRASAAKNKTKNFIAGEPGLARTIGKVSLALFIFGIIAPYVLSHIFGYILSDIFNFVFYVPLFMSIIIGCIGFVLSKKEGKTNLYAVVATISSLSCILFLLLLISGLLKIL